MKKVFSIMMTTILLIAFMGQTVFATDVSLLDGKIIISDTANTGKFSNGTYTATAKGGLLSKKTNTITITNETADKAKISFSYTAKSYNSFKIDGKSASATGDFSETLEAKGTITIVLQSNSGLSNTTATLTLSSITYETVVESVDATFEFDSELGTVKADGADVSDGDTITIGTDGIQLVATPESGAKFIAWVNGDGKIIERSSSYTQTPVSGLSVIKALFTVDTPYFSNDKNYMFDDLNAVAVNTVDNGGSKIVLECDGTLPAGDYTIPSGVTLLIPFDDANTVYTTAPGAEDVEIFSSTNFAYRTLTLASGATIDVDGAISVSAKQSCKQNYNGSPFGAYGCIDMQEGSEIIVNTGAKLYVWGYVIGSGSITAESGATIYEDFQVRDWRGGDATSNMIDNSHRIFPMSQYYVQNIEVPLTLKAGAIENGYMSITVSLIGTQGSEVPFIGPNGMFDITSGSITKDYDETTDRLVIDVDGELKMQSLSLSMRLSILGTKTISSEEYTLPINGNVTLNINNGSKVNVSQEMALLPGGEINVYEGAECKFTDGVDAFIYAVGDWGNYCSHHNLKIMPVNYACGGNQYVRTEADLKDAMLYIEGTIDASDGSVYTTGKGANIYAFDGAKVILNPNQTKEKKTYQAIYNANASSKYDAVEIAATNAKLLKNDDGTYVEPEALKQCWLYSYVGDQWMKMADHNFVDTSCVECNCKYEETATNTAYIEDDDEIVISPSVSEDVDDDTRIIIGTYNSNGKALEFRYTTAAELETLKLSTTDVASFKVFTWEADGTLTPFAAEKVEL